MGIQIHPRVILAEDTVSFRPRALRGLLLCLIFFHSVEQIPLSYNNKKVRKSSSAYTFSWEIKHEIQSHWEPCACTTNLQYGTINLLISTISFVIVIKVHWPIIWKSVLNNTRYECKPDKAFDFSDLCNAKSYVYYQPS